MLIFPIDEISDMDDIAATVEALGSGVDWVLVKNKVKTPRTRMFDGSELERELDGFGAVRLELPALLSDTRNHLRAVELQEGRGISPAEALRNPDLKMDTKPLDEENHASGSSPCGNRVDRGNSALRSPRRKRPTVITLTASALLGGIVACAGLLAYQHHRLGEPVGRSAAIQSVLLARAPLLTVEPWSDPVAHREKGCVILIGNSAWTESTQAGGTKVYVLSPVEEVRRNLESLRQLTRQSTSKGP